MKGTLQMSFVAPLQPSIRKVGRPFLRKYHLQAAGWTQAGGLRPASMASEVLMGRTYPLFTHVSGPETVQEMNCSAICDERTQTPQSIQTNAPIRSLEGKHAETTELRNYRSSAMVKRARWMLGWLPVYPSSFRTGSYVNPDDRFRCCSRRIFANGSRGRFSAFSAAGGTGCR